MTMLKIRLQRVGRKNDPSFRVVLTDSKNASKSGNTIETLGNYDPKKNVKVIEGEKIKYWISKGAQVSDTVHNILVSEKIIEGKKINVLPKKSPIVNEEKLKAEAEAKKAKEEKEKVVEETAKEEVVEKIVEEGEASEEAVLETKDVAETEGVEK